jgi:shikimate kinase
MNPAPNHVLIGPMGAGKSTIGRKLARRLGLDFVDADQRLEDITGATVPMIFECEGEAGFRARESQLLAELMQGQGQLIATGGGAVLAEDNRRLLKARGFIVYLRVDVDQQLHRLARDRSRPLLAGSDRRGKLEALAEARGPIYAELADYTYDSPGQSAQSAAAQLAEELLARWQRQEAA